MAEIAFRIAPPGCDAVMTIEVFEEDGHLVCGIYKLNGSIELRPKAWLRTVRAEIHTIEGIAKSAGCTEMRLGGRDWSRVLPDYEACEGIPNGLRKAL